MSDKDYSIDAHERWQRQRDVDDCDNDIVIEDHYNIVHNICNYYRNLNRYLEYAELEQVGMLALMKAKCCWNPDKHTKWLTYATGYVKSNIWRKCIRPYQREVHIDDFISKKDNDDGDDEFTPLVLKDPVINHIPTNNIMDRELKSELTTIMEEVLTSKEYELLLTWMNDDILVNTSKELKISRSNSYLVRHRALYKLFNNPEIRELYRSYYGEFDKDYKPQHLHSCEIHRASNKRQRERRRLKKEKLKLLDLGCGI